MKKYIAIAATLLLAIGPFPALADLDVDGNGSISKDEAEANEYLMNKWDELDADGNGEISAEELAALAECKFNGYTVPIGSKAGGRTCQADGQWE